MSKRPYKPKLLLKCKYCGEDVWRFQSQMQKNTFCNSKCANAHNQNGKLSTKQQLMSCTNCGTVISKKPSDLYTRGEKKPKNPFCSKKCSGEWCVKNQIGIHAENYQKLSLRSKLELHIEQKINDYFPYLIFSTNECFVCAPYELDFWFPDLNLGIEINGIIHYEPIHGEDHLIKVQSHDNYKQSVCNEKGYTLIIIPNLDNRFTENTGNRHWNEEIYPILRSKIPYCENK